MKVLRFAAILSLAPRLAAQVAIDTHVRDRAAAGSDMEQYLRVLQVAGVVPDHPWSIRGFSPQELNALVPQDTSHPWGARMRRSSARLDAYLIAPQASEIFNSSFPYGYNDGPLWAGRGLTEDVQFGFGVRAGPLSLVIDPEVFRAENAAFPLQPNQETGKAAFADAYQPLIIDQPQRFGTQAYQRVDAGQSTLRLDAGPIAVGASTADEFWGPAVSNPIILGDNAAGFRHLFAGTSRPLNLWLVTIHGRAIWGALQQSPYSPVQTTETRRFGTGVVGTATVRGLPGLEIGASRFFHEPWPPGGPSLADFRLPFVLHNFAAARTNLAAALARTDSTNQLASIFGRWVFPGAGLEVYGEFGRDDYNIDIHDLIVEPDHISAYTIGVLRTWRLRPNHIVVFRSEVLNSRITHLALVRGEAPWYVHYTERQGHTELGQVLGSMGAEGGGAAELAVDSYSESGRWTIDWTRRLVQPGVPPNADVQHGFSVERTRFGRRFDVHAALTQVIELNRRPNSDVGNLNLRLGVTSHW